MTISVRELLGPKDPSESFSLKGVFQDRLVGLLSVRDAHAILTQQIDGKPRTIETTTLFPNYLPDSLVLLMKQVSDGLQVVEVPTNFKGNASAIVTNTGRKRLRVFLNRNTLHRRCAEAADAAYQALAQGRIGDVDEELEKLANEAVAAPVNELLLDRALVRQKIPFQRADPGGTSNLFLPAYNGPRLSPGERRALLLLLGLCSQGPEFVFRTALLRAERALRQRRYETAIEGYQELRRSLPATDVPDRRLLLGRQAIAHAGLADRLYRQAPDATTASLEPARSQYDAAEDLLIESGVNRPRPGDPPAQDPAVALFGHVLLQKQKIAAHLNPLGLHDSMIPIARPDFLLDLARTEIGLTKDLAAQAQNFLLLGNEADKAIARLDLEVLEAGNLTKDALAQQEIARKEAQTASDTVELTALLQKIHAEKSTNLTLGSVVEVGFSALGGPAAAGSAFKGIISTQFDLTTELTQLAYQAKAAAIQVDIATIQQTIADRAVDVAMEREEFLKGQRDALIDSNDPLTLTRDVFYRFAEHFDALARERFGKAHRLAYLFERAAAFRLGTTVDEIGFAYLESESLRDHGGTEIFSAPFDLQADLEDIRIRFGDIPQPDTFPGFEIFLKTRFPLEFQRLRQEGITDFSISLYDLDKFLPGISNQRVGATTLRVFGNVPAGNVSVQLTHRGPALVRDHATILSDETTRLIPTPDQIDDALQALADGNVAGALVNGVWVLQQPNISKFLPPAEESGAPTDLVEFALGPLEDYGIAGAWAIEVHGMPPKNIADIQLLFDVSHFAANTEQSGRIKQLVAAYENEIRSSEVINGELPDRIVLFGMSESFADELGKLLNQAVPSETSFRLNAADHFTGVDFDPVKARVKGVLAQVVHVGQDTELGLAGIELTFGREDFPTMSKKTFDTGFTENLEKEIQLLEDKDRFPVLGLWHVRLEVVPPAAPITNVRWFFVLETP